LLSFLGLAKRSRKTQQRLETQELGATGGSSPVRMENELREIYKDPLALHDLVANVFWVNMTHADKRKRRI
jgi:hypothetical protein